MTRKFLLLVGVALLCLAPVASAMAQTYPPTGDEATISDSTLEVGQPFTVSAQKFTPGQKVLFVFNSDPVKLGVGTANASGVATISAITPNVPAGTHTITAYPTQASCDNSNLGVCSQIVDRNRPAVVVTVVARTTNTTLNPGTNNGGGSTGTTSTGTTHPAVTGAGHTRQLLGAAFALLAVGSSLVVATRRRNLRSVPAA